MNISPIHHLTNNPDKTDNLSYQFEDFDKLSQSPETYYPLINATYQSPLHSIETHKPQSRSTKTCESPSQDTETYKHPLNIKSYKSPSQSIKTCERLSHNNETYKRPLNTEFYKRLSHSIHSFETCERPSHNPKNANHPSYDKTAEFSTAQFLINALINDPLNSEYFCSTPPKGIRTNYFFINNSSISDVRADDNGAYIKTSTTEHNNQ